MFNAAASLKSIKKKGSRKLIFNSLTFIFLCFIPCILCVLLIEKLGGRLRIRIQNVILVLFSLLFYAWSGTQVYQNTGCSDPAELCTGIFYKEVQSCTGFGDTFKSGHSFYYKYLNLIITTYNDVLHRDFFLWEIIAPLGISFIIFQCISYIFDRIS